MKKKRYSLVLLVFLYISNALAEENKTFLSFDANYKGDIVSNTMGGMKQGVTYLGYALMCVQMKTEDVRWWNGGTFYAKGANTHGGEPSSTLVGDLHVVDNIEAGNHTFMQEFWFNQSFADRFDFTIGLQDLNADFAVSDETGIFVHSCLGINSLMAGNVSVPIFPLMGLGVEAGWNITDRWRIQAGAFDGLVTDFEENPYNVEWKLSEKEGLLTVAELHYRCGEKGTCKLGGYYHTQMKKYGFYLLGEKRINHFGVFGQVAWTPKNENETYMQMDAGFKFHNLFTDGKEDALGLAAVCNLLNSHREYEAFIEMTYRFPVLQQLWLQPDLQYVINPAGVQGEVDNALVAMMRLEFEF
ncbi:MAG: carbohydrate porin [Paludibacteraceae bacterium]|nr:carbohydrate porin [Paludibacteraceae bacterium]HPH63493.1 carbohydrate porin [Paludibacteraceae bacterium]